MTFHSLWAGLVWHKAIRLNIVSYFTYISVLSTHERCIKFKDIFDIIQIYSLITSIYMYIYKYINNFVERYAECLQFVLHLILFIAFVILHILLTVWNIINTVYKNNEQKLIMRSFIVVLYHSDRIYWVRTMHISNIKYNRNWFSKPQIVVVMCSRNQLIYLICVFIKYLFFSISAIFALILHDSSNYVLQRATYLLHIYNYKTYHHRVFC